MMNIDRFLRTYAVGKGCNELDPYMAGYFHDLMSISFSYGSDLSHPAHHSAMPTIHKQRSLLHLKTQFVTSTIIHKNMLDDGIVVAPVQKWPVSFVGAL